MLTPIFFQPFMQTDTVAATQRAIRKHQDRCSLVLIKFYKMEERDQRWQNVPAPSEFHAALKTMK